MVHDRQKMAVHERLASQGNWSLKLEHYLTTLLRKPGALAGSVVLQQVPHLIRELFDNHFTRCPREFPGLLQYACEQGYHFRDITDACGRLRQRGLRHLSADSIKAELHSDNTCGTDGHAAPTPSAARDLIPGQSSQIEQLASDTINDTDELLNHNVTSIKTAI